jgi:hypothetical protein
MTGQRGKSARRRSAVLAVLVTVAAAGCVAMTVSPADAATRALLGDCRPSAGLPGGCPRGHFPVSTWTPYSPFSPFNTSSVGFQVSGWSSDIVSNLSKLTYTTNSTTHTPHHQWPGNLVQSQHGHAGWPTYYSDRKDPLVKVTCGGQPDGACPPGSLSVADVHIPPGALPQYSFGNLGFDRHLTVIDQSFTPAREFDFWKVPPGGVVAGIPPAPPTLKVGGMGWESVSTGDGVTEAGIGPDRATYGGATAANFGNSAGRIRAEELAAAIRREKAAADGELHHSIAITVNCDSGQAPVYPAVHQGQICDANWQGHAPAMGGRFRLNVSQADIEQPGYSPWQKVLLRTMRDYGMIIDDTGSDSIFTLQLEGNLQYRTEQAPDAWWALMTGDPTGASTSCLTSEGWDTYQSRAPDDPDPGEWNCVGHLGGTTLNSIPTTFWSNHLQYLDPPGWRVTGMSVSSGPTTGGQQVKITGSGFIPGAQVKIGGAAVNVTVVNSGTITATTTAHASGPVEVSVSQLGQTVSFDSAYSYSSPGFWQQLPGAGRDLSAGADGSAWLIGESPASSGGSAIYHWTGTSWQPTTGAALRIAVAPDGNPWIINSAGSIYRRNAGNWQRLPGTGRDIGLGADGSAWLIGSSPAPGGFAILRWTGTSWQPVPGGAVRIAVDPDGNPWIVNSAGSIYRRGGNQWQQLSGTGKDIGLGADGSAWLIGSSPAPGGFGIYRWTGTNWQSVTGAGTAITVDPHGLPWIVNSTGAPLRRVP